MKNGKAIIDAIKKRGYVWDEANNAFEPPQSLRAQFILQNGININTHKKNNNALQRLKTSRNKTGWVDDTLNIKNKTGRFDPFIELVRLDIGIDVWPEFYFATERQYRFDYAIPLDQGGRVVKIAIESDGGTMCRGNSGHSSPTGIARDMDKGTLAAVAGWKLIRRTPQQLCTGDTIELIRQALKL